MSAGAARIVLGIPTRVVVVGRGGLETVASPQHGGAHLLGAGLPVCSTDRDHRPRDRAPPVARQHAIRLERVLNPIRHESGDGLDVRAHHRGRGSRGTGGFEVVVPVEPVSLDRDEQSTWLQRPGVG